MHVHGFACAEFQDWSFVVLQLKLRKERGQKPFTVMSCDNMPDNGHVARRMCSELAEIVDPELAAWISEQVPFPVTMVDRITPITMPDDVSALRENTNIEDKWPVMAEDYMQWVIEDKFVDGNHPDYAAVGALVVDDVTPYEFMKLRLLNGGHSALSYGMCQFGPAHSASVSQEFIRPDGKLKPPCHLFAASL